MKNYVQAGDTVEVTAPYAVSSGNGVLVGKLFGVAVTDAESGKPVQIKTTGVFDLPKNNEEFNPGDLVGWYNTLRNCGVSNPDREVIGVAISSAPTEATTVRVRLNGTNTYPGTL